MTQIIPVLVGMAGLGHLANIGCCGSRNMDGLGENPAELRQTAFGLRQAAVGIANIPNMAAVVQANIAQANALELRASQLEGRALPSFLIWLVGVGAGLYLTKGRGALWMTGGAVGGMVVGNVVNRVVLGP